MKKTILIAAVMFFALSVSAFAQVGASFTASSEQPTVACCGLTERTGNITFNTVQSSIATITGTITVNYPLPLTNLAGPTTQGTTNMLPAGVAGIEVVPSVPGAAALGTAGNDPVTGNGFVNIDVAAGFGAGGTLQITLRNVRLNVTSLCGTGPITASLSSVNNTLTVGETNVVPVVFRVSQALQNPTITTAVSINAANAAVTPAAPANFATITVAEGFQDAFGLPANPATGTNVGKMIRLSISGTVPAGVTLSFPVTDNSGLFTLSNSSGALQGAAQTIVGPSAGPTNVFYQVTAPTNPTLTESLVVPVTVTASGAVLPLVPTTISVTAHIAPTGTETTFTVIPRYTDSASCNTTTVPFVTVAGAATTSLLTPFATFDGTFDTGITVANTTLDPGAANMGITNAAIPQSGTITYYFFPQTDASGTPGATFNYTTKAGDDTLGGGLEADGTLAPGGSHIVLLSQLLTAAGKASDFHFAGYMIIVTRFTNAHGQYFISDFETFSNGGIMLVIGTSRPGTESLGQ